jgi:hypothetical protein
LRARSTFFEGKVRRGNLHCHNCKTIENIEALDTKKSSMA